MIDVIAPSHLRTFAPSHLRTFAPSQKFVVKGCSSARIGAKLTVVADRGKPSMKTRQAQLCDRPARRALAGAVSHVEEFHRSISTVVLGASRALPGSSSIRIV